MPMIPAFCISCGTSFSSGISAGNVRGMSLQNNMSGPCPKCGSMGRVIDGIFNVTEDVIEIVSAPHWTHDKLNQLADKIKEIRDSDDSTIEKTERFKQEAPELASLANLLPKTRSELYSFLTVILFSILVLKDCAPEQKEQDPIYEQQQQEQQHAVPKPELNWVINKVAEEIQKV